MNSKLPIFNLALLPAVSVADPPAAAVLVVVAAAAADLADDVAWMGLGTTRGRLNQ